MTYHYCYDTNVSLDAAYEIFRHLFDADKYCSQQYKVRYAKALRKSEIKFVYFPIAKAEIVVDSISYNTSEVGTYVSGYSGTVEGSSVHLHPVTSTYTYDSQKIITQNELPSSGKYHAYYADPRFCISPQGCFFEDAIYKCNTIDSLHSFLSVSNCEDEAISIARKEFAADMKKLREQKILKSKNPRISMTKNTRVDLCPAYVFVFEKHYYVVNAYYGGIVDNYYYEPNSLYQKHLNKSKQKDASLRAKLIWIGILSLLIFLAETAAISYVMIVNGCDLLESDPNSSTIDYVVYWGIFVVIIVIHILLAGGYNFNNMYDIKATNVHEKDFIDWVRSGFNRRNVYKFTIRFEQSEYKSAVKTQVKKLFVIVGLCVAHVAVQLIYLAIVSL